MEVQNLDLGLEVRILQIGSSQVHEGPDRDHCHVMHKQVLLTTKYLFDLVPGLVRHIQLIGQFHPYNSIL